MLGASYWYRTALASGPSSRGNGGNAGGGIWGKLIPFAAWILLINVLSNLYGYADRYLILHYAPGNEGDRLAMVGQYHSARVVPLLLASLATLISVILLPHLSHDWESGRRERVSFRLNLFLKLATLGLFAAATAVLAIAPLLFDVAFRGKFAGGSAALPGMLVAAVWFGAAVIAQQYIWCAERTGLVCLALGAGLAGQSGDQSAAAPGARTDRRRYWAAIAANLVLLLLILYFARLLGFHVQRGAWILLAAPASLCLGPWIALGVLAAISFAATRSELIFIREDKEKIRGKIGRVLRQNWQHI